MNVRVGVILDRQDVTAWEFATLRKIADSSTSRIAVVLFDRRRSGPVPVNPLLKLYMSLDRKFFRYRPDALAKKDIGTLLTNVPVVTIGSQSDNRENEAVAEDAAANLKTHDLDVLLDLGRHGLGGMLTAVARCGVWYYNMRDRLKVRGGEPGFQELAEGLPVAGSMLEILLRENGKRDVLVSSYSRTHKFSLNRGRNIVLWKSTSFVQRKLEELSRLGRDTFLQKVERENSRPEFTTSPRRGEPSMMYVVLFVARQAWRVLRGFLAKWLYVDQWLLAYAYGQTPSTTFHAFQVMAPPKDRFWADPHVIRWNDRHFVFLEEYLYRKGRGHISVMSLEKDGRFSAPVVALDREYHLSYPFVFSWEGVCYMIPETSRNKTIELYECTSFPDRWTLKLVLMQNLRAVDATLLRHENRWWLFTNIAENEGAETIDELFLFSADDFRTSQWIPHPLNPIVSDVRKARPAGRIFAFEGFLYRPSQDCSEEYGGAVSFHRISTLTQQEYREVDLGSHKPEWDRSIIGLHTYSRDQDLTVIDLCKRRARL